MTETDSGYATLPAPVLTLAFVIHVELGSVIEQGRVDGRRKRFVPISGGRVTGNRLNGIVLPIGGDWQTIGDDGLTEVDARYAIQADDGAVIDIINPGMRVASVEITERLGRGDPVEADAYYFRTTPRFSVAEGPHGWLRRTAFVARGTREPGHVVIQVYSVDR